MNWSCFKHAVACMNKPCRVVLQLYVYEKLSILDSCFRLILYLLYMQLEFRRYVMLCHRSFTEIEYSIPFIHGSLGALLLFCFAKQRENNEALNSEQQKRKLVSKTCFQNNLWFRVNVKNMHVFCLSLSCTVSHPISLCFFISNFFG